jgi:arylsulfatase A-like enzyme
VPSPRRPNLVVFLPDQQRADTITAEYAPNLAKLAEQAVVFEYAYVTHPVCTPSRSSIMTGTWPHQNGCTRNSVALPPKFKCLPGLVDSGYVSAYLGKWHLGNDSQTQRGFQHWVSTEGISDYNQSLTSQGHSPDQPDGSFSARYVSSLPIELSKTRYLEKYACEFIAKNHDKPFILFVAFVEPHSPYNGPLNSVHPAEKIVSPATAPLSDDTPLRYRLMREWQESEALLDGERLPMQYYFGITLQERKGMRQRYLGLVTQVDQSIGTILQCLNDYDVAENTIVVHTSDHGDMLGDHGLFGKEVMFEEAVHIPWLIKLPGQESTRRIAVPVSQIDFLPTMVELLGGRGSPQFAGTSRAALIRGEATTIDSVFIEWAPNRIKVKKGTKLASRWQVKRAVDESTRAIVTADGWKLCLRDRDLNELYNLNDDPGESRNLYGDRQYKRQITALTEQVHRWQRKTGDKLSL